MNSPNTEKASSEFKVAAVKRDQPRTDRGHVRVLGRGLLPRTSHRLPQGNRPKAKRMLWSE